MGPAHLHLSARGAPPPGPQPHGQQLVPFSAGLLCLGDRVADERICRLFGDLGGAGKAGSTRWKRGLQSLLQTSKNERSRRWYCRTHTKPRETRTWEGRPGGRRRVSSGPGVHGGGPSAAVHKPSSCLPPSQLRAWAEAGADASRADGNTSAFSLLCSADH